MTFLRQRAQRTSCPAAEIIKLFATQKREPFILTQKEARFRKMLSGMANKLT